MVGKYLGRRHEYCRLFCRKRTSFPTCMYKSLTNYAVCNIRIQQVKGIVRYVYQRFLSEQVNVHWEQCCNHEHNPYDSHHCPGLADFIKEWIYVVNSTNA